VSGEDLLAGSAGRAMGERELEILGYELLNIWTADICGLLNFGNFQNVDRPETGSMPGSQICIHGLNRICP